MTNQTLNSESAVELLRAAYQCLNDPEKSMICLDYLLKARALEPDLRALNYALGCYFNQKELYYKSCIFFKKELELNPNLDIKIQETIYHLLAWDISNLGRCEEATAYFSKTIQINPHEHHYYNDLIYAANHAFNFNDEQISSIARIAYENCFEKQLEKERKIIETKRNLKTYFNKEKFRIGILSSSIHSQSAEVLLIELFKNINLEKYEFYTYYLNDTIDIKDKCTEEYQHISKSLKNIKNKSVLEVAEIVLNDEIDILIDTLGHVKFNCLDIFSLKAAPVQISTFGYWGSTGLPQMDYLIVQKGWTKEEEVKHYNEKIIEIEHFYYKAKCDNMEIKEAPCLKNNFVKFGCFNRGQKINRKVLSIWSVILNYLPNSELTLSYRALSDSELKEDIWQLFEGQGIERKRIQLYPQVSTTEYFKLHNEIDVILEPFPFSGNCTTVDALWMGVPVIAKKGDKTAGRFSESLLNLCELPELIAEDESDYILKAISLGKDCKRIQEYRTSLREKVRKSGISDPKAAAKHFEKALDTIVEIELNKENP